MDRIKPGRYQHFKGKFYEVIGIATDSETLEEMVVYKALYEDPKFGKDALWVRPRKSFMETVTIDERKLPRFMFISKK